MRARQITAALLVLSIMVNGAGFARPAEAQPIPAPPPPPGGAEAPGPSTEVTPVRVSYLNGQVSFWRPGAQDWAPAALNTPLAPGDVLYAGQGGDVEIQIGPRAFVRATGSTQLGLDNQEPDFIQLRVTGGQAALDLRELAPGTTVELDTPNAAFTVDRAGYYRVDVDQDATSFGAYRGGSATMTAAGGAGTPIATNQQVVVKGTDSPQLALGAAPQLTAWDNWNFQRTDYLLQPASARYVSPGVYGAEALGQYGAWRTAETYGSVWVPAGVSAGWAPYTTGRWIWDPRFGWSWLDTAPWGWAPYHYGRWIFIGSYWAWAPGPIVVRPAYAPALVVFLGGVTVSIGHPLCWAPLGWGEPIIPWWGRRGFVGVPWWGGWGGPRVVNNVVVNRNTTINVTNITVYRNVHVTNAVVGVPVDRFGHGPVQVTRISQTEVRQLTPVRGVLEVKPVAASVMPATGPAVKPPGAIHVRAVVATRPPQDVTPALRAQGLTETRESAPVAKPRLVPSPQRMAVPPGATGETRPGTGMAPGQAPPTVRGPEERKDNAPQRPTQMLPPGTPPAPPSPEQKSGKPAEQVTPPSVLPPPRPTPPPPAAPKAVPRPVAPSPEQKSGKPAEQATPPSVLPPPRPTPPPPAAPKAVTPPAPPSPEQKSGKPAEQVTPPSVVPPPRPTPPPPAAPKAVPPPVAPSPEQKSGNPTERVAPARPAPRPDSATPPPAENVPRVEPPARGEQPGRGEPSRPERKEQR
jgi:hypothetical protein